MTQEKTKCPVPPVDVEWRHVCDQPSPEHFIWGEDKVGIPRQLMHQLHRYDHSLPTGSYAGKMWLGGQHLWWIYDDPHIGFQYGVREYEEIGEYDPSPHLEPCPLCNSEAYCGFEAKNSGDLVKFHITCYDCGLTFGNEYNIGLDMAIKNSVEVMKLWNKRQNAGETKQ